MWNKTKPDGAIPKTELFGPVTSLEIILEYSAKTL